MRINDIGLIPHDPAFAMKPLVVITYCRQCNWLLRAAWMAQELLSTFAEDLGAVTLAASTGGAFSIEIDGALVWERKRDGGFPDIKTLKQIVRDRIDPGRDLGHVDRAAAEASVSLIKPGRHIADLIAIMARLRTQVTGCPWDLAQDFSSIAPYTIEEAYEVADAIERGDFGDLADELGDLLLQVVFHARMAEEAGFFAFGDVVEAINAKMIRRHPHIFGDTSAGDAAAVKRQWEAIKGEEKAARAARRAAAALPAEAGGLLADVPVGLPALTRAIKLQKRAGEVGFDWNDPRAVLAKIREELEEFEREMEDGDDERRADELGDILFAVANLARHMAIDPETALRGGNAKFVRRFGYVEEALHKAGRRPEEASLDEMEALWAEAKLREGQRQSES